MKVGIFGDSFAASFKNNPTKSWIDVVAEKYETVSYGQMASSLYYSLQLLEEKHEQFDKCILVVTAAGRFKLNVLNDLNDGYTNIASLPHCEDKIRQAEKIDCDPRYKKALVAALDYYHYIYDIEKEQYIQHSMLHFIKSKIPNLILIPTTDHDESDLMSLDKITHRENKAWGLDNLYDNGFRYHDKRNCHMTEQNNIIFGTKVIEGLAKNKISYCMDDFVDPPMSDRDFYIKYD